MQTETKLWIRTSYGPVSTSLSVSYRTHNKEQMMLEEE